MSKVDMASISTISAASIIEVTNSNNELVEEAFENTLSRDGTSPNEMEASLDMNSNRILNLPAPATSTEPVRLVELSAAVLGDVDVITAMGVQDANTVLAGPTTGADATPTFRALVVADVPVIPLTSKVSGKLPMANLGNTGSPTASTFLRGDDSWQTIAGGGNVTATTLTANQVVLGNSGTAVKQLGSLGTVNTVLQGNSGGAPTWSTDIRVASLGLNSNTASLPTPLAGTLLQIGNANSTVSAVEVLSWAANPSLRFIRASGTAVSPSAVSSGDNLGNIGWFGYGASAYSSAAIALIAAFAEESFTNTAQGTGLSFWTTPTGSVTEAERFRIQNSGSILYTNLTAPATPAAGKVAIWTDSTDARFHDKNSSGSVGTTVVADSGASNNFLTAISNSGVISKAQPGASNLSNGITGTGSIVLYQDAAQTGGTHIGLTGLGIRSTGAAFDLKFANSEVLTATRTLTFSVGNTSRTLNIPVNLSTDVTGNLPVANLGSGGGVASIATFLRGDNQWGTPAGGGTVTNAANLLDDKIVRGDGGTTGVQKTNVTIDDSDFLYGYKSVAFQVNRNGTNLTGLTAPGENLIVWTTENLDNKSCFASNRFTPNVAGWYHITLSISTSAGTAGESGQAQIWKNGIKAFNGQYLSNSSTTAMTSAVGALVQLNGSTDYVEGYVYMPSGVTTLNGTVQATYMQGFFVTAA